MHIERDEPLAAHLLDTEVQQSKTWLERIIRCTHEDDAPYLLALCKATLCCLRRTLPTSASAAIAESLPLIVRGIWYEQWRPDEAPLECLTIAEFVTCARPLLSGHYAEAVMEEDVLAVLRALFETFPAAVDIARPYLPPELIWEDQSES